MLKEGQISRLPGAMSLVRLTKTKYIEIKDYVFVSFVRLAASMEKMF
jgi:hypothetical protein